MKLKKPWAPRTAAEKLAQEVEAYRREHDHPLRDPVKLKLDYEAMIRALREYQDES